MYRLIKRVAAFVSAMSFCKFLGEPGCDSYGMSHNNWLLSKVWNNNSRPRLWRFLKSKNFNTSPAVADPDLQGRGWGGFPPLYPPLRGTLILSMSPSNSSWSPFGSNRNSTIWICQRHCHSYLKRLSPTRSHTFPFCIVNDRRNSSSE